MNSSTFDARHLLRALNNAAIFAGSDGALPALVTVRIEYDGAELTAVATDRYTLGSDKCSSFEPGEPFNFVLPLADAKRLTAALKSDIVAKSSAPHPVTITVDGESLVATTISGLSISCRSNETEFPRWRSLLPESTGEVAVMGFTPTHLAKFAKVEPSEGKRGNVPMRMSFTKPTKVVAVAIGEAFHGLIMPVRLPEAS